MAAIFAAAAGAETTLVERTPDGGRKILISGGGRCNILPASLDERRFVTDSPPPLLRRILRSWPLREQIRFFEEELGLRLVEEAGTGKLFPASNRARDVRDGLLALASRRGARLLMGSAVTGIARSDGRWRVDCAGRTLDADAVIVATGGLSVPATGSDGEGLRLIEQLGHRVHSPYAALTPLLASPAPYASLAGLSLTATVTAASEERSATATGGFLFTHRGYSGPAVLDVSHVAVRAPARAAIRVRWTTVGERDWDAALRAQGTRRVESVLREHLPDRLASALASAAAVEPSVTLASLRREARRRLLDALVRFELPWTGHEGFRAAEVTGGGVDLAEVDPRTLESRRCPGLYLCGELLDAFGPIGGYNFVWAWVTGRAAGMAAARGAAIQNPSSGV